MMPPRRPAPPYILFSNEYISKQSDIKASMSAGDVSQEDRQALFRARGKAVSAAWKELPEFEKEVCDRHQRFDNLIGGEC